MLVVDASVIAPAVADGGPDGDLCRAQIRGQVIAAPDLLHVEVLSAVRRHTASGGLSLRQADDAIDDLLALPVTIYPAASLLRRCWELRDNVTAYDACYVALAEALGCTLLTTDARLAKAPGPRCQFDVV